MPKLTHYPRRAHIVVACSGPKLSTRVVESRFGEMRSREGALLEQTANDAERVHEEWTKQDPEVPDDLRVQLVDPTLKQLADTLRQVSTKLRDAYPDVVGLDFFFAGHGAPGSGDLVLRDGELTPRTLLGLQASDIDPDQSERTVGLWLDSCYSGAFLVRFAIQAFEDFRGFRLDEGLASCLPDEECFEMEHLGHGVFTYTRLHPGNSHVDAKLFNEAILRNDKQEIAKGLQGLVGMIGNPSAFLTEARQFSMALTKHVLEVHGGYATAQLEEITDLTKIINTLTAFKRP